MIIRGELVFFFWGGGSGFLNSLVGRGGETRCVC